MADNPPVFGEWQPIAVKPEIGTKAILYFPEYEGEFDGLDYAYQLAIYKPCGWCDQGTNHLSLESGEPTAWMPLPEAPKP